MIKNGTTTMLLKIISAIIVFQLEWGHLYSVINDDIKIYWRSVSIDDVYSFIRMIHCDFVYSPTAGTAVSIVFIAGQYYNFIKHLTESHENCSRSNCLAYLNDS